MKTATLLLALSLLSGTVATAQGTLSNGLQAYYPFSGNAQDVSGNNRHLTNMGATLTTGANGTANSAYYFDGMGSYMMLGATAGVSFIGDFTICMKVKPLGYFMGSCHGNVLLSKNNGGNDPYGLTIVFDDNYYTGGRNCTNPVPDTLHQNFAIVKTNSGAAYSTYNVSTPPYADYNVWRSLVMMSKGDTLYQYIDGALINRVYAPTYGGSNSRDIFFGKTNNSSNTYFYKGVMDELRFYNRALTPAEVVSYGNYNPLAVTSVATATAIVLSPNPAMDQLKLTNPVAQPARYQLLDLQGREVLSGTLKEGGNDLPVSQLAQGLYLLQLQQGEIVETRRFLKQ